MNIRISSVFALLVVVGCAETTVTPISRNQIMISTSAEAECGTSGAMKVATKMAAIETLRRGYERYIIAGADTQSNVSAVNMPPTYATTNSTYNVYGNSVYGNSYTNFGGGGLMMVGTNDAGLHVVMFKRGERGFNDAVDAKSQLGPDWQKLVKDGVNTCTD